MTVFPFQIKTRRNVVVEVGVTANTSGEIVNMETADGDNGWGLLGELVRLGYAEKVRSYQHEEVYRLRRDRVIARPIVRRDVEPDGIEPLPGPPVEELKA